jgi:hypothetical protein
MRDGRRTLLTDLLKLAILGLFAYTVGVELAVTSGGRNAGMTRQGAAYLP